MLNLCTPTTFSHHPCSSILHSQHRLLSAGMWQRLSISHTTVGTFVLHQPPMRIHHSQQPWWLLPPVHLSCTPTMHMPLLTMAVSALLLGDAVALSSQQQELGAALIAAEATNERLRAIIATLRREMEELQATSRWFPQCRRHDSRPSLSCSCTSRHKPWQELMCTVHALLQATAWVHSVPSPCPPPCWPVEAAQLMQAATHGSAGQTLPFPSTTCWR